MTKILHNSIFFSIFAPDFGCMASARPNSINHKRPKNMASIQDIHALEAKIYDAVQEYIDNPNGYEHATLHVYLDRDEMEYQAEMEDNLQGSEDDGIYSVETLVREGDDGLEPDNDRASDIANSWIFLD